jgi:hypothetical protein
MIRTCQNSLGQNGTCLGLLLLLVGPNGDGFGGQAFMEHYNIAMNSSVKSLYDVKHIFPDLSSCLRMCSVKLAACPPLKYDNAQWMRTCSSTKSDVVSEI